MNKGGFDNMDINIKNYLTKIASQKSIMSENMQFPDCIIDPEKIKVVMINEVVPRNPDDWFYSGTADPENRRTAFGLFERAGVAVKNMQDVIELGIYITTALKTPKEGYTANPDTIAAQLPLMEAELALFPNLKVIMLMGDVAKKSFNMITKARTKKNAIPSKPTGYIRVNEYFWNGIRVFPTYIMTGKNLLIEKGKCDTISEDIRRMMDYILRASNSRRGKAVLKRLIVEATECGFKRELAKKKPKSWLKSVSVFANGIGGMLFCGVLYIDE